MSRNESIAVILFWVIMIVVACLSVKGIVDRFTLFILERGI